MIQMEHNFRMLAAQLLGISHSALSHIAKDGGVGIVACALRHLHDYRRLSFHCSLNDGLHLFHCVKVECGNSITSSNGSLEHFSCVDET